MPGWGTGQWGLDPWGGSGPAATPGNNPPSITQRVPLSGAVGVAEDALVTISFLDIDLDLDTTTVLIEVNGVPVYTGLGGFASGYVGRTSYSVGTFTVQFVPLASWGFEEVVTFRAYAEDFNGNIADDTWSWTTQANPTCYTGLTPLPIEVSVLSPMVTFLELETARRIFLDNALQIQERAIPNAGSKAARVMYQQAFATELSTVQNPGRLRNEDALKTVVCERERMLTLDTKLLEYKPQIQQGIQSLFSLGALPREYISAFQDYLDSTMYTYRVSLVANLVILAKYVETQT